MDEMAKRSDTRIKKKSDAGSGVEIPNRTTTPASFIAGLQKMQSVIKSGEPLEKYFRVRTVMLVIPTKQYGPEDVKAVIAKLKTTSMHLGLFLGVATETVSRWEEGSERVPEWACRYLDDITDFPQIWKKRLKTAKTVVVEDKGPRKV
jgi:DNA-binding transcriptional regulator YiaG